MILQERDKQIIDFLEKFHVGKPSQLMRIILDREGKTNRFILQRRLKTLVDNGHIKRFRDNCNSEFIYTLKKDTKNTNHYLMLVDFYLSLKDNVTKIDSFDIEKMVAGVIPDVYCHVWRNHIEQWFFVEIHRSNNPIIDVQNKYIAVYNQYKQEGFKYFPRIIIVTDKDVKVEERIKADRDNFLNFVKIKGDCSDIRRIFFH